MPRVSDDWIRDEIGNCPPDDGEWQAKMNSALSEVLLSRRVIEAVRRHAHYGCCVETWQDVAGAMREYDAAYPKDGKP